MNKVPLLKNNMPLLKNNMPLLKNNMPLLLRLQLVFRAFLCIESC